jgi:hypothetical protein
MSERLVYFILFLFLLFAGTVQQSSCQTPDFTGYRLFINPGHGGYDSDDRHMLETEFWESEGNLVKGLFLRQLMINLKATTFMSRTTNTTADDLPLSSISAMANAANADFFLAIHSNGYNGTQNQPLMLFRGYDDQPVYPESKVIAGIIWDKVYEKGNCWTSSTRWVKGDWTFYPDWGIQGLGVLRGLTMPGVLSEGSFHDYIPEGWRLRNHDFLHHESWAFVRALTQHENVTPVTHGLIAGIVRDTMKIPSWYFKPGTRDQRLPMNGAQVTLIPGNRKYKVDNLNNGFFMFDSVAPGPYKLIFDGVENFMKDSLEVNVVGNKTTLADIWIQFDTTIVPQVLSVSPMITDSVVFNQEFTFTFSLPMNRDSVQKAIQFNPTIQLSYSWDEMSTVLKVRPSVQYLPKTNYSVTVTTVACSKWKVDIASAYNFSFITKNRTRLKLQKCFPASGKTGISIYPQIRLIFDAPLDESQLTDKILLKDESGQALNRTRVIYTVEDGRGHYYFEPSTQLSLNKIYKITLDQNLADIGGNKLGKTTEINFTTRSNPYLPGTVIESFDNIAAFWDPEASGSTVGTDNPLTTFTSSSLLKREGTSSGMLDYVFVNPSGGVCRTFDTRKPLIDRGDAKSFGMWVFGDFSYNALEYWFYLAGSTNSIVPVDTIDWAGWELKTIPVSAVPGNTDFNFHSIVIRQTSEGEKTGTMWFDEASIFTITGIEKNPESDNISELTIYPNPFSASDNIVFTLKESAEISLTIVSITGISIESLASGVYAPGEYKFTWTPGSQVGSGIYLIRLEVRKPGFFMPRIITKRCILIR